MATISHLLFVRHLRAEPTAHVLHFKGGKVVRSGRGLAFWFLPLSASIAEVPCDDRDQAFLVRGRSSDFQEVTVQGVVTFRVADPERIATRIDWSVDLRTGRHLRTPLELLSQRLGQLAQQLASDHLEEVPVRQLLSEGVEPIRQRIAERLPLEPGLRSLGIEVVSVRVASVAPTAELEKALQAPVRESIQQASDEAVFQRRALAVEKERAIQENELQNRIELARREEGLIGQQGQNALRKVREQAEAERVASEAASARKRLEAAAEAESLRLVEQAKVASERERMEIQEKVPPAVLLGLAAQALAGKLQRIDHVSLGPELLPLLSDLVRTTTKRLEAPDGPPAARAVPTGTDGPT
jgi:regulator of protease activity HflC (stomatin/prohibitin superfamily)